MERIAHDHLGSVDVVTGATGTVIERLSYDAFGKRRTASGTSVWRDAALPLTGAEIRRGFTDHEHLDAFALIHMNGRIYDPHLGRFLSADPFIQFLASTQGLNRYSYVLNNPLSLTDPSGYFIKWAKRKVTRLVRGVGRALRGALKSPIVQTAVSLYICSAGPQACAAASATFTALNGGDLGEVVFAAALTFVSAEAYGEVGRRVTHPAAKTVAHGVVGGVVAELGGGRFRTGFISAGAAQFAAPWIDGLDEDNTGISAARVTAAAVVGGTAATLGGGKFANGAVTAAFGRLFDDEAENWFRKGRHTYGRMERVCSESDSCQFSGVRDRLFAVGVHPNQTVPFEPGQPYVGDVDLPGPWGEDHVSSSVIRNSLGIAIGVRNVTLDNHLLHPGWVERTVLRAAGSIYIHTWGGGSGYFGGPNIWLDDLVWGPVDQRVKDGFK